MENKKVNGQTKNRHHNLMAIWESAANKKGEYRWFYRYMSTESWLRLENPVNQTITWFEDISYCYSLASEVSATGKPPIEFKGSFYSPQTDMFSDSDSKALEKLMFIKNDQPEPTAEAECKLLVIKCLSGNYPRLSEAFEKYFDLKTKYIGKFECKS